jgi:hypothetical protein
MYPCHTELTCRYIIVSLGPEEMQCTEIGSRTCSYTYTYSLYAYSVPVPVASSNTLYSSREFFHTCMHADLAIPVHVHVMSRLRSMCLEVDGFSIVACRDMQI